MLVRIRRHKEIEGQLLNVVLNIRKDHPTMSIRSMYYKITPEEIGRDQFEAFCISNGLRSQTVKNPRRTTDSSGVKRFPNLIENLDCYKVNQAWSSDITYYEVGNRFYYLTFILDIYSRFIKGHEVSSSLKTEATTLPALKKALRSNKVKNTGLIFHSDGGGQYYCDDFLDITKDYQILNSMSKEAYQNPYSERLNGIIKNQYLAYLKIISFQELVKAVDRTVSLYNYDRPHKSLKYSTPAKVEEKAYFCNGQPADGEESFAANSQSAGHRAP